jgi:4-amino-4-deoxy-L-arabinose transferase-like glycosyltransferase
MNSPSASLFHTFSNSLKTKISRELELISVVAIFISSLFVRILFIGLTEFKVDIDFWCWEAWQWINGGPLPLRGDASWLNIYVGPFPIYLTTIAFLIFNPSPESGIFMVAWTNTLTILFSYLTGRDMFNHKVGILSALLFGFSPWAIIFSRKIWNPSYLPFTLSIVIWSFYKSRKSQKSFYFLIGGFALGVSFQFHSTAFAIIPVILVFVLYNRCKTYNILITVLGVLASLFPMIIFDFLNEWTIINGYINFFFNSSKIRASPYETRFIFSLAVIKKFFEIAGGTGIENTYGSFYPSNLIFLDFFSIEMILLGAYFLWIFAMGFKHLGKRNLQIGDSPHFLLSIWLIVPLILHLLSVGSLHHHYFIIFYPANCLAIAAFMDHFLNDLQVVQLRLMNSSFRISALKVLIGLIILFHLTTISAFLYTMKTTGGTRFFGSTLENKKAAVNWIINDEDFHDYRVIIHAEFPHTTTNTYRYLFNIQGKEMSEGKPLHYYYILDMKGDIKDNTTLDEYQGSISLIVRFGSVTVIKTKCL